MTIDKIYGNNGAVSWVGANRTAQEKGATKKADGGVQDRVDFSSVLQQVNQGKQVAPNAEAARAEKVQALKAQIASGSYQPDLEKVAASLLQFIAKGKG